jgi:hypothetical protein
VGERRRWSAVLGQMERAFQACEWDGAPAGGRATERCRLWASAVLEQTERTAGAGGFIARDVAIGRAEERALVSGP